MRYALAAFLFSAWVFTAPWIAKGYGDWRLPTPANTAALDLLAFYLLPLAAAAIAVSTYRLKRST